MYIFKDEKCIRHSISQRDRHLIGVINDRRLGDRRAYPYIVVTEYIRDYIAIQCSFSRTSSLFDCCAAVNNRWYNQKLLISSSLQVLR